MKKTIKKIIRNMGWELRRFNAGSLPEVRIAQLFREMSVDMVFDVGANVGQFSLSLRSEGFNGRIISFEPLSSARAKLLRASEEDKQWFVHPQAAIGDQDGEVEINIAGNSVSSSALPMLETHSCAAPKSAYISSERVPVVRLDSVLDQYLEPDSNLFIKIDTQGFEWQVLDGANEALSRARGVLCELSLIPLYEGQRRWRQIVDRLEAEGFQIWAIQQGFSDPQTGQQLQMDGLFFRPEAIPPKNQRSRK